MAILKVARLGHPVLRQVCPPVPRDEISTPEVQRLFDDMVETMREHDGIGLAANQVHVLLRVAVLEIDASPRYPDAPSLPLLELVNPQVTPLGEEQESDWEGCLSVPDLRGLVPRFHRIRLQALTRRGEPLDRELEGWPARVVQHELDHLDGKVFLDRMPDLTSLSFLPEWLRYGSDE